MCLHIYPRLCFWKKLVALFACTADELAGGEVANCQGLKSGKSPGYESVNEGTGTRRLADEQAVLGSLGPGSTLMPRGLAGRCPNSGRTQ